MKLDDLILVKRIIEAAILASEKPLTKRAINELFDDLERPEDDLVSAALDELAEDCNKRGYELVKVASGYRFQVKQDLSRWVSKLWKERAPRYSRALLETLALIAYRQPITRGEIEDIRGVAVSSQIIKTLLEREWIKAVGHKDVPGRPAIYATTKLFLDYFNLKNLDQLPPLAEIRDINAISQEFNIEIPPEMQEAADEAEREIAGISLAEDDVSSGEQTSPGEDAVEAQGESAHAEQDLETESSEHGDLEHLSDVRESDSEQDLDHTGHSQSVEMHAGGADSGEKPLNC